MFSLWSPAYPGTDVDLFVEEPFPFEAFLRRARVTDLYGVPIPIVAIPDLIAMKRVSSRPEDLDAWERHRLEQTKSWLRLTAEQRLEWLEGAKEFARDALGAAYRRPAATPDSRSEDPR